MSLTRILLAFILSFGSVVTTATDLSPDQAQSIWVLAWGQTHSIHKGDSTILFRPPVIHLVTKDQLCTLKGLALEQCGNLQASQYEHGVYLLRSLDFTKVLDASIAFHEMVHYIQFMSNGERPPNGCSQYNAWEFEARRFQAIVLRKANDEASAQMVMRQYRPARCI